MKVQADIALDEKKFQHEMSMEERKMQFEFGLRQMEAQQNARLREQDAAVQRAVAVKQANQPNPQPSNPKETA